MTTATEWAGHSLESVFVRGRDGNRIPCHWIRPKDLAEPVPWVLALHGATSSKHEWTEFDGYTHGGNATRDLVASGISVVAMDLRHHGENRTDTSAGLNVFEDGNWGRFFQDSVRDAMDVLEHFLAEPALDPCRSGFVGYSMGGTFGFWLANHHATFKAMAVCVPYVDTSKDTPSSSHNNLGNLGETAFLQISAERDEYIPFEESKKLFERNPAEDKTFLSFESGHSLPAGYVSEFVAWVVSRLQIDPTVAKRSDGWRSRG